MAEMQEQQSRLPFRKGDEKLMARLTPIVYILVSVSETLEKGVSLVSIQPFYDMSNLKHPHP